MIKTQFGIAQLFRFITKDIFYSQQRYTSNEKRFTYISILSYNNLILTLEGTPGLNPALELQVLLSPSLAGHILLIPNQLFLATCYYILKKWFAMGLVLWSQIVIINWGKLIPWEKSIFSTPMVKCGKLHPPLSNRQNIKVRLGHTRASAVMTQLII